MDFFNQKGYLVLKNFVSNDFLTFTTYRSYIIEKIKRGGIFNAVYSLYKKIRKFTIISAFLRTLTIIIAIVEKSAILLLVFSFFIVLLPAILIIATILSITCVAKYIYLHRSVNQWIKAANQITVFLTAEKVLTASSSPLFLRMAEEEAASYDHPVVVLVVDRFISAKWYSLNILLVRADYFFLLKRFYFSQKNNSITYIGVS